MKFNMNVYKVDGHLEGIPELNEALRHRVVQKEINQNRDIQNVKEITESHSVKKERDRNEVSQSELKTVKPPTDDIQPDDMQWTSCDYCNLPTWLQHNDCLLSGHRPPLPSFTACFQSMFRIHTETVNIWTHLLGCVFFIILAISSLSRLTNIHEILAFSAFFAGAILCLGFSFIFHTLHCHSPRILTLFSRLDYCGITLLITGSFVPWLYFCFYCQFWIKLIYLSLTSTLGLCALVVSLLKQFGASSYRPYRAAVFTTFGLSGVIPGLHYLAIAGWDRTVGIPLITLAFLYILGAALYACRFPEKLLPGRCDIWFHSHQVFHILVVIATVINYQGLIDVYNRSLTLKCL